MKFFNSEVNRCAVVTGATGYIGSRLVKALVAECWQVHVIVRNTSSLDLLQAKKELISVHIHDGSMGRMMEIISITKPDVVFHLAAISTSDHHAKDVDGMVLANILFSTQLVEAMFRNGIVNLVNTETFWQHSKGTLDYSPVCLYAATKQAFRDILMYYADTRNINAISLILYDTYGSDDPRNKLINFLKKSLGVNKPIDMTSGDQFVDLVHIDDVITAFMTAGEMLFSKKVDYLNTFSVTSGQRIRLRHLVELIERNIGISLLINWGGKAYRANEVMEPWVGKTLPGWSAKVDLVEGICDAFK